MRATSTSAISSWASSTNRSDSREQGAEFVHRALAVPRQVGARSRRPRPPSRRRPRRPGPTATPTAAARSADLPTVMFDAERLASTVAPASAAIRRRRHGRPVVLADLDADHEVTQVVRGEDQVGAERHGAAADLDRQAGGVRRPRRTSASRSTRGSSAGRSWGRRRGSRRGEDHRGVVEPPAAAQRRADQQHGVELLARRADGRDRAFDGVRAARPAAAGRRWRRTTARARGTRRGRRRRRAPGASSTVVAALRRRGTRASPRPRAPDRGVDREKFMPSPLRPRSAFSEPLQGRTAGAVPYGCRR